MKQFEVCKMKMPPGIVRVVQTTTKSQEGEADWGESVCHFPWHSAM